MKKFFLSACAVLMMAAAAYAQDVNQATDLYNNGASALSEGNKVSALDYFIKAKDLAQKCGEAGNEIVANCDGVIPSLYISIAKEQIKAAQYESAVSYLNKGVEAAKAASDEAKATEAERMIPAVYMQQGSALIKKADYPGAIAALKTCLQLNPENGRAALLLGQAYDRSGDQTKAEETYLLAKTLGQAKAADKQLVSMYNKIAAQALKAKDNAAAKAAADKANSFMENDKSFRIGGQAAMNLGDNAEAIRCFEKYLELAPTAADANDIRTAIEALKKQAAK